MRLITFTLCLLINTIILAQDEFSFLKEEATWVQETFFSDGYRSDTTHYTQFELGELRMIDGKMYQQVYKDGVEAGAMREEEKRLIYYLNGEIDTLLDFNLMLGDTVRNIPAYSYYDYMVLRLIDTIEVISDGSERRRFNFDGYNGGIYGEQETYQLSWIDGIGSTRGFLPDIQCWVKSGPICIQQLACHAYEDNLVYANVSLVEPFCEPKFIVDTNEPILSFDITVYPNPSWQNVQIEWDANTEWQIKLHDQLGRLLFQSEEIRNNVYELNLAGFPKGFYWLEIKAGNEFVKKSIVKM